MPRDSDFSLEITSSIQQQQQQQQQQQTKINLLTIAVRNTDDALSIGSQQRRSKGMQSNRSHGHTLGST
jgi:hypothetical protein